jgi:hypothetical protein
MTNIEKKKKKKKEAKDRKEEIERKGDRNTQYMR